MRVRVRDPAGVRNPWEVRDSAGGPGPQAVLAEGYPGIRGATGPFPSGERVRGRLLGELGSGPQGSGYSVVRA